MTLAEAAAEIEAALKSDKDYIESARMQSGLIGTTPYYAGRVNGLEQALDILAQVDGEPEQP